MRILTDAAVVIGSAWIGMTWAPAWGQLGIVLAGAVWCLGNAWEKGHG